AIWPIPPHNTLGVFVLDAADTRLDQLHGFLIAEAGSDHLDFSFEALLARSDDKVDCPSPPRSTSNRTIVAPLEASIVSASRADAHCPTTRMSRSFSSMRT